MPQDIKQAQPCCASLNSSYGAAGYAAGHTAGAALRQSFVYLHVSINNEENSLLGVIKPHNKIVQPKGYER